MNEQAELRRRALLQAVNARNLSIELESATWKTDHVAKLRSLDGASFAFKYFSSALVARRESSILSHLASSRPNCGFQSLCLGRDAEPLVPTDLGPMMVTHWIDGATKPYHEVRSTEWRQLGRALASLHETLENLALSAAESISASLCELDLEAQRSRIREDTDALRAMGVPNRALTLMESRRSLLDAHGEAGQDIRSVGHEQVIHNDFNVHNYIFGADGTISVIDWDRSIYAPREYEVVRCLNHLPLESPQKASEFVNGYLESQTLDPATLSWAVHAALLSHATKHWPAELARKNHSGAIERLLDLEPMVVRLAAETPQLLAFYEERSTRKDES